MIMHDAGGHLDNGTLVRWLACSFSVALRGSIETAVHAGRAGETRVTDHDASALDRNRGRHRWSPYAVDHSAMPGRTRGSGRTRHKGAVIRSAIELASFAGTT